MGLLSNCVLRIFLAIRASFLQWVSFGKLNVLVRKESFYKTKEKFNFLNIYTLQFTTNLQIRAFTNQFRQSSYDESKMEPFAKQSHKILRFFQSNFTVQFRGCVNYAIEIKGTLIIMLHLFKRRLKLQIELICTEFQSKIL